MIITAFFPPLTSIASQRPYSWAKYWSRAGHDVTVLTVPRIPTPFDSPQSLEGFRVIEVPIPGMTVVSKIFGHSERFVPSSSGYCANGKVSMVSNIKGLFYRRHLQWRKRYGFFIACRMPDQFDFWNGVAFKAIKNQYWDLVVSTAWPYGVNRPAYQLKKAGLAARWITDWRDLWVDNHMYPGLPGFRTVEQFLEKRWSQAADVITTVSEPLADTLRVKYGDKVHVVYNGFDPEEYEILPVERVFPDDGVFRIVYTGTIYPGQRDPSPLFEAVHKLHKQGTVRTDFLKIIFCGCGPSNVNDLAQKYFVTEFVEYVGFLQRKRALCMQRDADALLFLELSSEKIKGILSGKLFEYLFAGPPIIGVGMSEDSSVGHLLKKTKRGKCFDRSVEKIAEELQLEQSRNSETISFASKADYQNIAEFSREEQSKKMLSLVS